MRRAPEDDSDAEELAKLNAPPWMVECLKLNPSYVHWGPYEDYMSDKGSWREPAIHATWSAFGPMDLNDFNEVVHFYFSIEREGHRCEACKGIGLNPKSLQLQEDFYDFADTGRRWCDAITQDELDMLIAEGRFRHRQTEVNLANVNRANTRATSRPFDLAHDSINAYLLLKHRATKGGFYGYCEVCIDGQGFVYTAPTAHLQLTLWVLHPRKGASRGMEVSRIEESELPAVFAYLTGAAERSAERFSRVRAAVLP